MGQHCFAGWHLSSSVTLPEGGPVGRRERGNAARKLPVIGPGAWWSARRQLDTWAVGRPTLHGGPVVLHPVRETSC